MKGLRNIIEFSPITGANQLIGITCDDESVLQYAINNYTLPVRWKVLTQGYRFYVIGDDGGVLPVEMTG